MTQDAGTSEHGQYLWNESDGSFSVTLVGETDAEGGLIDNGSNSSLTLSVSGDTLTLDASVDFTRVKDESNTLIGSWVLIEGVNINILTILSATDYTIVHSTTDGSNPGGEYLYGEFGTFSDDGTYTTFVQDIDADGEGGLSHIGTDIEITEDPGVSLNFMTSTESFTFDRLD